MDEGDIARLLRLLSRTSAAIRARSTANGPTRSTHAMAEFNKRAKANFEVKVASLGALDPVKQQKARLSHWSAARASGPRKTGALPKPASAALCATRARRLRARDEIRAHPPPRRGGDSGGRPDLLLRTRWLQRGPQVPGSSHGGGTGGTGTASVGASASFATSSSG